MKKQDRIKRRDKNQMAEFYSVGWHMEYADQDVSLTSHTEWALQ